MPLIDDLKLARDNLASEFRKETEQRLADQAAGKGVKTTYTANGRTVDWLGYIRTMREEIKALDDAMSEIANDEEPFELHSQGIT